MTPAHHFVRRLRAILLAPCAVFGAAASLAAASPFDPVVEDPPVLDARFPPRNRTLTFPSSDGVCHATLYSAQGEAPRPVILLLHGTPGMDGNRDLARVFQRAGYHVFYFYYRGAWGSSGDFSHANAVADVHAAIAFLRSDKSRTSYRIDPRRLILVGHSFGGWAAFMAAATDPSLHEIASLAGSNEAIDVARMLKAAGSRDAFIAQATAMSKPPSPLVHSRAEQAAIKLADAPDSLDTFSRAPALRDRRLLLVKATRDRVCPPAEHHDPMVLALRTAGAVRLETHELEDDHGFTARRIALARVILGWLGPADATPSR
jgi:pimeloyl-ACP methyl ester carboxylesterase